MAATRSEALTSAGSDSMKETTMPLEKMPVVLTEEERSMRAREAARLMQVADDREEQKKELTKELGDEIRILRTQATAAARAANSGVEEREVPVSPRANNDRFLVEFFRDDTGELVRTRPMTDDEARAARQAVLPLRSVTTSVSHLRGTTRAPVPTAVSGEKP